MELLINIQDEYIETVNAGIARWSHRKDGGHAHRIRRGAHRKAEARLGRLGFKPVEIDHIIGQARDMAALLRLSGE